MKLSRIAIICVAAAAICRGQDIDISGMVQDSATGEPVAGVEIKLAISGLKDTTDDAGEFHLIDDVLTRGSIPRPEAASSPVFFCRRGALTIRVADKKDVSVLTYCPQGALVNRIHETMEAGLHTLRLPQVASGLYIHRITIGAISYTYATVGRLAARVEKMRGFVVDAAALAKGAGSGFSDTLVASLNGLVVARVFTTQSQQQNVVIRCVIDTSSTGNPVDSLGIPDSILSEYLPSGGFTMVRYKDPGEWTEINALDNSIAPINKDDPQFDASPQLIRLAEHYQDLGKRVKIVFPSGAYFFKSSCILKKDDGLWICSSGEEKARFILDCDTEADYRIIEVQPATSSIFKENLSGTLNRGQNSILVSDTKKYGINDLISLIQSRFPGATEEWKIDSENRQLCRITGIDEAKNLLLLDRAIGIDFETSIPDSYAPIAIRRFSPARNVRIEGIHFERNMNGQGSTNLSLDEVDNALVANCAFNWTVTFGLSVKFSHDIEIYGCTAEYWYTHTMGGGPDGIPVSGDKRSGSYGDAIATRFSTGVSIYNCTTRNLRHPFWIGNESSYIICAYNRSLAPYDAYSDIGAHHGGDCHSVIFEGNFGNQINIDPKSGYAFDARHIVFFRNKALEHIGNWKTEPHDGITEADRVFIVGNEVECIPHSSSSVYLGTGIIDKGENTFKGANLVKGIYENTDITEKTKLPESFIFGEKPDWHSGQWPLYGPRL